MTALDQRRVLVAVPGHPGCTAEFGLTTPARIHDLTHGMTYSEVVVDDSKPAAARALELLHDLVTEGEL